MKHLIKMIPLLLIILLNLTLSSCNNDGTNTDDDMEELTYTPTADSIFQDFHHTTEDVNTSNDAINHLKGQIDGRYGSSSPTIKFSNIPADATHVHIIGYKAHIGKGIGDGISKAKEGTGIKPPTTRPKKLPTEKDKLIFLVLNIEKAKTSSNISGYQTSTTQIDKSKFSSNVGEVIYKKWALNSDTRNGYFTVYRFRVYTTQEKITGIDPNEATPKTVIDAFAAGNARLLKTETHFSYASPK